MSNDNRYSSSDFAAAAASSSHHAIAVDEKAAVKKSIAQEGTFRKEKENILAAMGASPAVLLTPSANPNLQRKVGAYTNSRQVLAANHAAAASEQPIDIPAATTTTTTLVLSPPPVQHDDAPHALDRHRDELEQYQEEEQRHAPKDNKRRNCILGGIALCVILGLIIGIVTSLMGNSQTTGMNGSSSSSTNDDATKDNDADSDTADLACTWNRETACSIDGTLTIPRCAGSAYSILMSTDSISQHVVSSNDNSCDASHYGVVALAVAQTNYGELIDDRNLFLALATFFFAARGATWRFDTNWLEGTSPCSWYGIDCLNDGTIGMYLHANNLQGSLPTHIGMLSSLYALEVGRSLLSGSLPTEIGLLSELNHVSVSDTFLHGSIPSEIGNCGSLLRLDFQNSLLTGQIATEIGTLENLTFLGLGGTSLTGTLPLELGNLSNLKKLILGNLWSVTGTIPTQWWGTLTKLQSFSLSAALLNTSPFPTVLTQVTTLRELEIVGSGLTGSIPTTIGNLSRLDLLSLVSNGMSGTVPTEIGLLTQLEYLSLAEDRFVGDIPSELGLLTKLLQLNLSDNRMSGSTLPSELGALTVLNELMIDGSQASGTIPSEMCDLHNLKSFRYHSCNRVPSPCMEDSCGERSNWGGKN